VGQEEEANAKRAEDFVEMKQMEEMQAQKKLLVISENKKIKEVRAVAHLVA
jgi:hypothetical protein